MRRFITLSIVAALCSLVTAQAEAYLDEYGEWLSCESTGQCVDLVGADWPITVHDVSYLQKVFYFNKQAEPARYNIRQKIADAACSKYDAACKHGIAQQYGSVIYGMTETIGYEDIPPEWHFAKHWTPDAMQLSGPNWLQHTPGVTFGLDASNSPEWSQEKQRLHSITLRFASDEGESRTLSLSKPFLMFSPVAVFGPDSIVLHGDNVTHAQNLQLFETDAHWPRVEFSHERDATGRIQTRPYEFVKAADYQLPPGIVQSEGKGYPTPYNQLFGKECGVVITGPGLYTGFKVSGFKYGICVLSDQSGHS